MSTETDYDMLTDDELKALDAPADATDTTPDSETTEEEETPTPETETPDADEAETDETETPSEETDTTEPRRDGAVAEAIAQRRRAQDAEARAAEAEKRAAALASQSEIDRLNAQHAHILATEGDEAADEFAARANAMLSQRANAEAYKEQVRADADSRVATARLEMADAHGRRAYGAERYDAAVTALVEEYGAARVFELASKADDPAAWVIDTHTKRFATSPEALLEANKASIAAEVKRQVAEALAKGKAPSGRNAKTIAHVTDGGTPSLDWEGREPDDMTDAQLRAAEAADRKRIGL